MGFFAEEQKPAVRPRIKEKRSAAPLQLGCDNCTLKQTWGTIDSPRMCATAERHDADIFVIGEAPGKEEDRKGEQFVGQTGQVLRKVIPRREISRLAWQNAARCRPPDNRTPTKQEIYACSGYLEEDILKVRPKAILGVGAVPLSYFWGLTDESVQITEVHGLKFPVRIGDHTCWYFPVFHPSFAARSPAAEPIFNADVKQFFREVDTWKDPSIVEFDVNKIVCTSDFSVADSIIKRMTPPFAIDFETGNTVKNAAELKPYRPGACMLSAAISDGDLTVAFPVDWPGSECKWAWPLLIDLVQNHPWVAHNVSMELLWLWHKIGFDWFPDNYADTLAIGRIIQQRKFCISLEEMSRIHLGVNIKALTKVNAKKIMNYTLDEILPYNGLDAWAEAVMFHRLKKVPTKIEQSNIDRLLESSRSTVVMELLGVPVDQDSSAELAIKFAARHDTVIDKISKLPEVRAFEIRNQQRFSVSSPQQLGDILKTIPEAKDLLKFTKKGEESGRVTVNEETLDALKDITPLAAAVLEERETAKMISTYIKPIMTGDLVVARDSGIFIHPSYGVALTHTGRTNSDSPNIQNWPKRDSNAREIRRQVVAPPGHVLVAFDFKAMEVWLEACASKDANLCKALINKEDIHSYWLDKGLARYPKYLDIVRQRFKCPDDKLRKTARDNWKGAFVFGSLFGGQPRTLSGYLGIPMEVVEELQTDMWSPKHYPQVKKWMDDQRQLYKDTGSVSLLTGMVRHGIMGGNEPLNTPIQGTSTGHIVLEAQNALSTLALKTGDLYFHPRINIHDDLTFILPDDDQKIEYYVNIIGEELVKVRYDWQIVPLVVEWSIGYNWWQMEEIESGVFTGSYHR